MSFNKETKQNYLANQNYGPNSSGQVTFREAIPKYAQRLDIEAIITAKGLSNNVGKSDTNAQITIGRDRWPEHPGKSESANRGTGLSTDSGYASYHNAGAIDIVVGRGAPYPVEITGGSGQQSPLYNTVVSKTVAGQNEYLADSQKHDGVSMDAARIYISQMCKVDRYFKLNRADHIYANNGASSGIVIKADRLRLHARRDVYIHAGGDAGTDIDSCGASFLDAPMIHLMVGNGTLRDDSFIEGGQTQGTTRTTTIESGTGPVDSSRFSQKTEKVQTGYARQHPVPRGDNLVECLDQMLDVIKDGFEMINNVLIEQNTLNQLLANHIHATAAGLTTTDPIAQIGNAISTVQYVRCMISAFQAVFNNIPAMKMNYLKRSGYKYINSRNVTVT